MALYNLAHGAMNAEIMFQETELGHIANFIAYRANLGFLEQLGLAAEAGIAGAHNAGLVAGYEGAGRYDQAYLSHKMQADDMKNAKMFLQYEPLSAATLEKFDQWRDDIMRAAR